MNLITDNKSLASFCRELDRADYITVDTEFMRDNTYWPKLCLLQAAGPETAAAIDPLAPGIDLKPFYALLNNHKILKVFHAARQDLEIFFHDSGKIPAPIFDTQVAAMVCGFGDSVAYDTLVSRLTDARLDKASRITNWAHRPLTKRQMEYALADVTHLRTVYEKLNERLRKTGRAKWVEEEDAVLTDPQTYRLDPETAWMRLKTRSSNPRFLAVLREVAAWREREAQFRDLPRNRILRDDALLNIAAQAPTKPEELARSRGLSRGFAQGKAGKQIMKAVATGLALPDDEYPTPPSRRQLPPGIGPVTDLLKVLLKQACESHGVAQKLVATVANLEQIAADDKAPVPALSGWRRKLFGADALALKHGRVALAVKGRKVELVRTEKAHAEKPPAKRGAQPRCERVT